MKQLIKLGYKHYHAMSLLKGGKFKNIWSEEVATAVEEIEAYSNDLIQIIAVDETESVRGLPTNNGSEDPIFYARLTETGDAVLEFYKDMTLSGDLHEIFLTFKHVKTRVDEVLNALYNGDWEEKENETNN
jgi:hypothetical protein